jgi:8-oxo-dGTP diphosphatase
MTNPPLQVACALICFDGRVLATRRDPGRAFPLLWEFPGGKIEPDESAEAALHRELAEELSLKVRILRPLEPVNYRGNGNHLSPDQNHLSLIPFLGEPAQEQAPVPHEHVEMRWIRPAEAQQLEWAPADLPLVRQLPELVGTA